MKKLFVSRLLCLVSLYVLTLASIEARADMSRQIPSDRVPLRSDDHGNFLTDLATTPEAWAHLKDSSVLEKYAPLGEHANASYGGSFSQRPDAQTYDGAFFGPQHSDER